MDSRELEIRRDLSSSDIIPKASKSTYDLYFHVARLLIGYNGLLELLEELNDREKTVTGTKTTTEIGLANLDRAVLHSLRTLERHLDVAQMEGIWYD